MAAKKILKKATGAATLKSAAKAASKKVPAKETAKKASVKKAPPKTGTSKASVKSSTKKPAAKQTAKKAPVKAAAESLVGKKAPAFKLEDQSGKTITSASLKGQAYVLYFYPKDNTPGCTTESCDFRDGMGNFKKAGVSVFGVSPDSVKSHAGFAQKYELPFTLISDPDKVLAQAYGVWALKKNYGREYWGIVRSTFLIGSNGKVVAEWRGVRVKGHVDAVLEEAKGL